ncbi:MAG TPA: hypothetical protein GXX14_03410 [Clostridiaceae bacterium]|nr:hypothetical protein [Clostridiaceae bacterium]
MSKKILCRVLSVMLIIVFLLAACGKQEEVETPKTETQTQSESTGKQEGQADQEIEEEVYDPFGKIEPTIEITGVRDAHPEQVLKYPEGDSLHDNIWTRYYENELGIKLKYLWITPFGDT